MLIIHKEGNACSKTLQCNMFLGIKYLKMFVQCSAHILDANYLTFTTLFCSLKYAWLSIVYYILISNCMLRLLDKVTVYVVLYFYISPNSLWYSFHQLLVTKEYFKSKNFSKISIYLLILFNIYLSFFKKFEYGESFMQVNSHIKSF